MRTERETNPLPKELKIIVKPCILGNQIFRLLSASTMKAFSCQCHGGMFLFKPGTRKTRHNLV